MRHRFIITLPLLGSLFIALLVSGPAAAQDASPASLQTRLSDIVEQTLEEVDAGAIVLVDMDGQRTIVTHGLANRETVLPMDESQMMRSASIGKLYTAAVIHRLILNGQIDLDEAASTYLQATTINGIANADIATVRQLITHTSGIPDYYDDDWFDTVDTVTGNTLDRTLAYVRGRGADFEPGSDYSYSNTNFQLLGRIAENVTGLSLDQLINDIIITPLDLESTAYNQQFHPADVIHGYGGATEPDFDSYELIENNGPDGGIFATAGDMADFFNAIFDDDGALANLGQSMLSEKYDRGEGNYRALGPFFVDHRLGVRIVGHAGSIAGYATMAIRILEPNIVVIVHLNEDRPDLSSAITRQILMDLLASEE